MTPEHSAVVQLRELLDNLLTNPVKAFLVGFYATCFALFFSEPLHVMASSKVFLIPLDIVTAQTYHTLEIRNLRKSN